MKSQKKRLIGIAIIIAIILSIPLIAMQFTNEVQWDLADFLIMGSMLAGVGLLYEFIARKSEKTAYRVAFGVGLLGAFLLLFVNGAVGIIGNEGQPANLLFGAVFVVGLVGSLIARFKAKGMALTLFTAAITQMLIPVIALLIWPPPGTSWAPGILGIFAMTAFFAILFVVSGLLFRRASLRQNLS